VVSTSNPAFPFELRRATDDDWPDIFVADARAFLQQGPMPESDRASVRGMYGNDDVVVVRDPAITAGQSLAGVATFERLQITVPGPDQPVVRAAGLTWVSVASTHRRRGILRAMMSDLFDQWESEEYPLAALIASEATIYERYGFGPATFTDSYRIEIEKAQLRAEADTSGTTPVVYAAPGDIAKVLPVLHDRWARTRPGAVHRNENRWRNIFRIVPDTDTPAPSTEAVHVLLHQDGYARYSVADDPAASRTVRIVRADVFDFVAVTDEAHRELWRVLLNLDLVSTVDVQLPTDDPLPLAVTDLRPVARETRGDAMWLRILDIPAALTLRGYRGDLDVVIDIEDPFRGRGGTFGLQVTDGVAQVAPSTAEPDVRMDIAVLGSIYLGAIAPSAMAAAGRLWTAGPDITAALDRAWATDRAPFAGTYF
jgi:predicted acetyltransferase